MVYQPQCFGSDPNTSMLNHHEDSSDASEAARIEPKSLKRCSAGRMQRLGAQPGTQLQEMCRQRVPHQQLQQDSRKWQTRTASPRRGAALCHPWPHKQVTFCPASHFLHLGPTISCLLQQAGLRLFHISRLRVSKSFRNTHSIACTFWHDMLQLMIVHSSKCLGSICTIAEQVLYL